MADIVLFGMFRPRGGTYRRLTNQIHVWTRQGWSVELVTFRDGEMFYADEMPATVRCVHLGTRGKLTTVLALWRYLRRNRPRAILSINHISNVILARVGHLPETGTPRFLSVPNTFGESEKLAAEPQRRERKFRQIRRLYPRSDGVIAVSDGVRDDLLNTVGLRGVTVKRIYSGSVTRSMLERAREPVEHPWLTDRSCPVILAAGRLAPQKDYPTLLRAFALLRERREARLIIVGQGREQPKLEALARELNIDSHVDLPGFVANPYAWMARCDVFALSSRWEGLVNVIMEALGLGVPVVSTDCPSGPREILADGRYGVLVPMRNPQALAEGLDRALRGDGPRFDRDEAVQPFLAETAARAYLDFFGLTDSGREDAA